MGNRTRILVVEDENNIVTFMTAIFHANNYEVLTAKNGTDALMMISSYCPDVVVLDLGLPDIDGLRVIRSVRAWSHVPIIVVSARMQERDKVAALDLGADDYVTKPFATGELLARVRTALRHARQRNAAGDAAPSGVFRLGDLMIDYDRRQVTVRGNDVHLTQIEYRIASLLSQYAGRVLTYDFMIKHVWGPHATFDNQILRVNMANIRRKIEDNPGTPKYILTEIGVGYRMLEGS